MAVRYMPGSGEFTTACELMRSLRWPKPYGSTVSTTTMWDGEDGEEKIPNIYSLISFHPGPVRLLLALISWSRRYKILMRETERA